MKCLKMESFYNMNVIIYRNHVDDGFAKLSLINGIIV